MLKKEWKGLFGNRILLIVTIAVIVIPTIYTTLFLGSMWDPYGNLDRLPVAVVNRDVPVTYDGKELAVGRKLEEELKTNNALDFCFPEEDRAEQGLKDGSYYMVITIPEDFSACAATVTDAKPEKMRLAYQTNPGTNYIASKMSGSAMKELENSVREEVTKTYARVMFAQIEEAGKGMTEAAEGSDEIREGAEQLKDGSQRITENLEILADSTLTFTDGSRQLEEGLGQYTAGVGAVSDGAGDLDCGAGQLKAGIGQFADKMPELSEGVRTLEQGAAALREGTEEARRGSAGLAEGAADVDAGMGSLRDGLSQLDEAASALPDSAAALNDGAASLSAGTEELKNGARALSEGIGNLQSGADELNAGLSVLSGQSQSLREGTAGISSALSSLADLTGQLAAQAGVPQAYGAVGEDGEVLRGESKVAGQTELQNQISELQNQLRALQDQAETVAGGVSAYTSGVDEAAAGSSEISGRIPQIREGAASLSGGLDSLSGGIDALKNGTESLMEKAPELAAGISGAASGASDLKEQGTTVLSRGAVSLNSGLSALAEGNLRLAEGTAGMAEQMPGLSGGISRLREGADTLKNGTAALVSGTGQLAGKSNALLEGAGKLSSGAGQICDGAKQLSDGSGELGIGLGKAAAGAETLSEELNRGADRIRETNTSGTAADMFAAPVETVETQITDVPDNGHAMAPYMMSVGLWVGCIAFSLMYPLTQYSGKLRSGAAWWLSKASVLYPTALLQALAMIGALHVFNGFDPERFGMTVLTACIASLAFMSVMYFFTSLLGRVGSFLMLIFMVIQLAGSVGTYPLEISGNFVPYLHGWVPFTYTVTAFRSTISGGERIDGCLAFLVMLFLVFSLLTILEFQVRAKKVESGKRTWIEWLEVHRLA